MTSSSAIPAGDAPIAAELTEGETVWWCACGRSRNQPFCDGSHTAVGMEPVPFTPKRTRVYYLCACKGTRKPPLCDGSHNFV